MKNHSSLIESAHLLDADGVDRGHGHGGDCLHIMEDTSRPYYRFLFDNMPAACFTVGVSGAVIDCNRAAETLFDGTRRRLIGRPLLMMADFSDHSRFLRHLDAVRALGRAVPAEFMFRRVDGSIFCGRFECARFETENGEGLLFCTVFDVSQAHRLEAELRAANAEINHARNEAEAALVAKSRFLAAASHDLRQPVQALNLYLDVLGGQIDDATPAANTIRHLRTSVEALSDLLSGILDLSRLEAGLVVPKPELLSLQPLLNRLESDFRPVAEDKGLSLRIRPTHATVHSDPLLLERILRNLLNNAVRYTNQGGIVVGTRHRRGYVCVEVVDSGIGIPENQLLTIFREFHQLSNDARNRADGLGLGLAIVERLVSLLALRLDVRSRVGRGSRFIIEIPVTA